MNFFKRPLSPPLEFIERQHLGLSDALIARARQGDLPPKVLETVKQHPDWAEYSESWQPPDMESIPPAAGIELSPGILELISRSVQTRPAGFDSPPRAGQIVRIERLPSHYEKILNTAFRTPLYVLLDGPFETERIWRGWLCAPEVEYASWWDFVLQEDDGSFSPEVGMVQLWNPVQAPTALDFHVVGQLSGNCLSAVRALAGEYLTGQGAEAVPVWPGRVAARPTLRDLTVVTGSPLSGETDERLRYQEIYFHAAEALRRASQLTLEENTETVEASTPAPTESLKNWWAALPGKFGAGVLAPEEAVPIAMDAEGSDEERTALHWRVAGVRLYRRAAVLEIANEGTLPVIVTLLTAESQMLDRREIPQGGCCVVELDDPEIEGIRLESGEHQLEILLMDS